MKLSGRDDTKITFRWTREETGQATARETIHAENIAANKDLSVLGQASVRPE
jgi:hypothetical protein